MPWAFLAGNILLWCATQIAVGSGLNRQGYKINPKPCWVDGREGTCMFVFECIKSGGVHIGMCVEAFMFGSCCTFNASQQAVPPSGSTSSLKPQLLYSAPTVTTKPIGHGEIGITRPARPPTHSGPNNGFSMAGRPFSVETTITARPTHFMSSRHSTESPKHSLRPMSTDDVAEAPQSHATAPQAPGGPGAAWQFTTEPDFITRIKKPSSYKPKPNKPTKKPLQSHSKHSLKPVKTTTTTTTTSTTTTTTTTEKTSIGITHLEPVHDDISSFNSLLEDQINHKFECGIPKILTKGQSRIVGGRNAPFGKWPWQVSVRRTSFFGFSSTHRCGGAILNKLWIATAGHCVDDLLTSQIRIRVGEYDFSSVQEAYPYVERSVTRKVVHPKYNFSTYEYDLALVQLEQELEFALHILPICLPESDDPLVGYNGTVTGWGRLSEGGTLPSILQEVQVPIVSNEYCKRMFLRAGRHEYIPEVFLCAGHEEGGQDSCQGDSGGPLQVKGKDGRYFLAGIISWGIGCAEANLPGVCTRISKFVPWILKYVV
ncbi:hypothetical protein GWI33_009210 [Rhynchophorus ferrugineus]|uniref:Peptidase S1 domain-containing protein n=1 Tax=Rhynchophorus ferrugineus TaxID=354439 RepID=A0A834IEY4_RHYFE|nr:hypothetical protein GWI33_009210 [Rhynchophorus ferrugineus]